MQHIPNDYIERCYSGWLGKIIGVRLGAPIEGWSYEDIHKKYGELWHYPVEYCDFAADDDTNGPMFFLRALHDYGIHAGAREMGLTWLNYAPYEHGFYWWGGYGRSTEHTAYLNLRAGIDAPRSGSIAQNGATVAEQIGGQIFIDTWGLVNPGSPARAAQYAEKAASVSHDGNGKYGGMFIAACIAAAFVETDIERVLRIGLSVIPEACEYAMMARDIELFYRSNPEDWRKCFAHVKASWGYDRYPGNCHIIPNSAVMLLAMYYGQSDFSKTICICNMCGWDTDCTTGNVGAILGVLVGIDGIAEEWTQPVNDFLAASSVIGTLNIMDVPGCVYEIARLAYAISGEDCPVRYADYINGTGTRYNFELPRSTHAFRISGDAALANTDDCAHTGMRCLEISGQRGIDAFIKTYYTPSDFSDSRYDPDFSPLLYPGQTVTAHVKAAAGRVVVAASLVAWDRSGQVLSQSDSISLGKDWTRLELQLDVPRHSLIARVGVHFDCGGSFVAYLDDMDFSGSADYQLDFKRAQMEVWTGMHRTPEQLTCLRGIWDITAAGLEASGTSYCEGYTGNYFWRDYSASTVLTPQLGDVFRFLFRVQGTIRCYAATIRDGALILEKNENGYRELARIPFEYQCGEAITLSISVLGNQIAIAAGDVQLSYADVDKPYQYGQVGWGIENGRMCITELEVHCQ